MAQDEESQNVCLLLVYILPQRALELGHWVANLFQADLANVNS
jgi:hypothetical protein